MKINAQLTQSLTDQRNQAHITFKVSNYRHVQFTQELEHEANYTLEIKKVKSKRSLQQNAYLWKLLHELEKESTETAMDWYIKCLIETGAVVDYVWGTEATETTLKKTFRAVQRVKPHKIKESDGWLYRVIVGSSKFNIEEMTRLIETVQRWCAEYFIDYEVHR
jgi:hypothetical protein